ncbi:hypothetical protein Bca4012_075828 [Brassica carinata]
MFNTSNINIYFPGTKTDWGKKCQGKFFPFSYGGGTAILGNGVYKELTSVQGYVCNGLFSIGEDGFGTRRMTSFCKLFGRYQDPESFLNSEIIHVPHTQNLKADSLVKEWLILQVI